LGSSGPLLYFGCDLVKFVPIHAAGTWLFDKDGKRMLDFTSGQMSSILGHGHPEVLAAIHDASRNLDHLFSSMISEPVVALAEKLGGCVPALPKVMLLSTGGEANEAAIKLAKTVTGKWEIVSFTVAITMSRRPLEPRHSRSAAPASGRCLKVTMRSLRQTPSSAAWA
jgi:2,2-dialkylglycine decarboxylase (pyruvate)